MKCPICKTRSNVIDSRRPKNGTIRRTRQCPRCLARFKTKEEIIVASIDTTECKADNSIKKNIG